MAKHLRIVGLVQGVGYRAGFAARAQALQLSGWVRNRRDGSVEAMVDGPSEALDAIVEWARRGPSGASVRNITIEETNQPALPPGHFDIVSTA